MLAMLCGMPYGAWAASPTASPLKAATNTPVTTAAPVPGTEVPGMGPRADLATLAGLSGGSDVVEKITLNGNVSDNHSDHVVTGANMIGADSFSGAAGVPMVIQNTGNGVLIQNATIINVQFQP